MPIGTKVDTAKYGPGEQPASSSSVWRELLDRRRALHVFGYTARHNKSDPIAAALVALVGDRPDRFAMRSGEAGLSEIAERRKESDFADRFITYREKHEELGEIDFNQTEARIDLRDELRLFE